MSTKTKQSKHGIHIVMHVHIILLRSIALQENVCDIVEQIKELYLFSFQITGFLFAV
jgi:hypothetical protein